MPLDVTENSGLNEKQLLSIALLATGASIQVAAKTVGVHERTVDRWLTIPEFKSTLRNESLSIYNSVLSRSVSLINKTLDSIEDAIDDPETAVKDRVSIARLLFDNAAKLQSAAIEERIAELESAFERLQNG